MSANEEALIPVLKNIFPLKNLSEADLKIMLPYGRILTFQPNENILLQGKPGDGLYIIISGNVGVFVRQLGRGNIELAHMEKSDFFGEISLLIHTPCTATITAFSVVTCYYISAQMFSAFSAVLPRIHHEIIQGIGIKLVERQRYIYHDQKKLLQGIEQKLDGYHYPGEYTQLPLTHDQREFFIASLFPNIFNGISRLQGEALLSISKLVEITDRYCLIQEEIVHDTCYLILAGAIQLLCTSDNKYSKIALLGPETLFCSYSFLDQQNDIFRYSTCGKCVLLAFKRSDLVELRNSDIDTWYQFYQQLYFQIAALQIKVNTQIVRLETESYQTSSLREEN